MSNMTNVTAKTLQDDGRPPDEAIRSDDDSISSQDTQATAFTLPGDHSSTPVTSEQPKVPLKSYAAALKAPLPKDCGPPVGPTLATPKAVVCSSQSSLIWSAPQGSTS
jgi:hypothetical protein